MRRLTTGRPLPGGGRDLMAAFAADPGDWLPTPARRRGLDRWTVDLVAGPLTRSVACHVGSVWRTADAARRSVSWQPQPEPQDVIAVDRVLHRAAQATADHFLAEVSRRLQHLGGTGIDPTQECLETSPI